MSVSKKSKRFCTGCGLCEALGVGKLNSDNKGYYYPEKISEEFQSKICPFSGVQADRLSVNSIWGRSEEVFYGWSTNSSVRKQASSGGALTAMACYLLENHIVDGIIQTRKSDECAFKNDAVVSTSTEEVLKCTGSRYSISHPLNIIGQLAEGKKYCLIAKPCDIAVFRNYAALHPEVNNKITVCMSFFCMGLPSDDAQKKLLEKLGCVNDCVDLNYRGNGWPGFATAERRNGSKYSITYDESWGEILGRDLMPYCRYCIDGIGEEADISCGDAWYIKDGQPDFDEHEGRNVIFARTSIGLSLLQSASISGALHLEKIPDYEEYLAVVQNSQYMRRASLDARISALRIMGKPYIKYNKAVLKAYKKHIPFKKNARIFLGMVKRTAKGKY